MLPAWMMQVLTIGFAGALGAISRWGVSYWVQSAHPLRGHWGTLVVNLIGCFLFGLLWQLFVDRVPSESHLRDFFLIGLLGSFTTFSTFAHDTHQLHTSHGLLLALGNIALSVIVGWAALVVGISLGKLLG